MKKRKSLSGVFALAILLYFAGTFYVHTHYHTSDQHSPKMEQKEEIGIEVDIQHIKQDVFKEGSDFIRSLIFGIAR